MGEKAKGWTHWSTNEKVAAVILLSVLAIFVILLGLIIYEPPTAPGLCGAIGPQPCPGREDLNIITAAVNSSTNMTIQILNTGSVEIFLISFNVRNPYSQPYANNNWSGPTVIPNAYTTINLLIDGNAFTTINLLIDGNAFTTINLLIDGNAFTFQSGTYYTITLITSRNNQFTFTIKAS